MATYNIPLGTHLYSPRFGYDHHGIYVGLGKVIHHSGWSEAFKKGPIECTTLKEFCAGNGFKIKLYQAAIFSPPQIVRRARQRFKDGNSKYNLLFNNCEHFATWCVTGKAFSEQLQEAAHKTFAAGAATIAARRATQKSAELAVARTAGRTLAGGYTGAKAAGATVALAGFAGFSVAPVALPVAVTCAVLGGLIGLFLDD